MIIFRNVFAVIGGWIIGSVVNLNLINLGNSLYPIEGLDVNDMEAFASIMPTLGAEYFIFPFLAHALGTFTGAITAGLIAANNKRIFTFVIGGLFLIGGIAINYILSGPVWFTILDLVLAYIPMAILGWLLINKLVLKKIVK
jgi:hypothetical protein